MGGGREKRGGGEIKRERWEREGERQGEREKREKRETEIDRKRERKREETTTRLWLFFSPFFVFFSFW